jgi:hypothetical protein
MRIAGAARLVAGAGGWANAVVNPQNAANQGKAAT